jgi:hypothetical protein
MTEQEELQKLINIKAQAEKFLENLLDAEKRCIDKSMFFREINCKREMRYWSRQHGLLSRLTSELKNIIDGKASWAHFSEDTFFRDEE